MSELGATSDPRALIPGAPEAIEENVIAIRGRGQSMIRAGEGLQRIDTGAWGGEAADAFRDKFSYEPPKWLTAGDSFDTASVALVDYAETLRWAQRQATEAIALWEQGEVATAQAQARHNAAVAQAEAQNLANAAAGNPAVVQVAAFSDPGEATRQAARDTLDRARRQLAEAGDRAAETIRAQTEGAPEGSSWLDDVGGFLGDMAEGAWGSFSGFVGTLWDIIPVQAIWDPQGYTDGLITIGQGLAHNVTHPVDFLKGVVSWDTWSESPGRAIGEILGGAVIGGGVAKVAGKLGKVDRDHDGGTTDGDERQNPETGTPIAPEEHRIDLGTDPATGTFRPGEAETGLRIEEQRGIILERAPLQQGPDWIGSDGKTYDAVGNFPAKYFDQQWEQLQRRIDQHLNKADYVPVDVSQFTPAQVARVREFVEPWGREFSS